MLSRRTFFGKSLLLTGGLLLGSRFVFSQKRNGIMTVNGLIDPSSLGKTLIHEHILVDFIGAAEIDINRWDPDKVLKMMLPFLLEAKAAGCKSFVDCTPNYLGRDVVLLKKLSERSGLQIITNTGYYGGSDHKFLPQNAFTDSAETLAEHWIKEYLNGIDGTYIKPGFIKISVNDGALSEISQKLIKAAAITHLRTGLTIASHTGPYRPASEQIDILKQLSVSPAAFIWVHAQSEKNKERYEEVAKMGGWVSLDGLNEDNVAEYVDYFLMMKSKKCLHRLLLSHDAGWYDPDKTGGGEIRGYTTLFTKLIPALSAKKVTKKEIEQVIEINPREAFTIKVRNIG